jgi:hypothetical protein
MVHSGFFQLTTSYDLRQKLHRELERLREQPTDQDTAFNFFITALSMIDWVYGFPKTGSPESDNKANVKKLPLFKICSHLANGAKHLELVDKRHKSVKKTEVHKSIFDPVLFDAELFDVRTLIIRLDTEVKADFGDSITAIELAERITDYWDNCPDVS